MECIDHGMFGTCPRTKCKFFHKIEHVNKQEFFIAKIFQMLEDDNFVSLQLNQNIIQKQLFFIGKGQWNRNDAARDDLVVFQTYTEIECDPPNILQIKFNIGKAQWNRNSEAQGDLVVFQTFINQHNVPQPRGRVFSVLSKGWSAPVPSINIAVKESAFTLDPMDTKCYDAALKIEDCTDKNHSDCKEIGIHIVVAATPQKVSVNDLSFYSSIKIRSKFKRIVNSLEKGKYKLAVSVYLHTANDFVTKPAFSVVEVTDNYMVFDDKHKVLWSHFKCLANKKIAHTEAYDYLSSTPMLWKERFVLDEVMAAFNLGVRKLVEKPSEFDAYFITASGLVYPNEIFKKIIVPEEFFERASKCFIDEAKYCDSDILPLIAAGRMSQWMDSTADLLPLRYERDVEICSNLEEERVVKCTSPMREIQHYLNQQILIRCMINEKSKLYERTELLGILGIRFRTPKLLLAVVKTIDETSFTVNYNGCQNINPEICEIDYATLCENKKEKGKTINLKKIFCDEKHYCTRSNISCDGKPFKKFIQEFSGESNFYKMEHYFRDMEESKESQVPTYTNADDGTMINLQLRSELQLQISNDDAGDKIGLGLRLLRIGRNCHLCLLHMNHPELAFMSDRKDIRDQNLESRIKILTKLTRDEKLNTIQLKNVNIEWYDEYFSGGMFMKTCAILPGDFLCIQKEIISGKNREGDGEYVWNAHGIVVTCIGGDVKFSVCTLSQVEQPSCLSDKEGFCVDIISTKQKNKL